MARILACILAFCLLASAYAQVPENPADIGVAAPEVASGVADVVESFPVSSYLNINNIPVGVQAPGLFTNLTLFMALYGRGTQQYLCTNESQWAQQSPWYDLYLMSEECNGPWAAVPAACSTGAPVGKFYTIPIPGKPAPGGAATLFYNPLTVMQSSRINITYPPVNNDTLGIQSAEWNLQRVLSIAGDTTAGVPSTSPLAYIYPAGGPAPVGLSTPNLPDLSEMKYWMRGFPQGAAAPPFACLENQRVDVPAISYFLYWK